MANNIFRKIDIQAALRGVKGTLRDLPTDLYAAMGTDRFPSATDLITMRAQLQDYEQVLSELQELQVEAERALKFLGEVWQRQVDRDGSRIGITHSIMVYRSLYPKARFNPPPSWDDDTERDLLNNTPFELPFGGPKPVSPDPVRAAQQAQRAGRLSQVNPNSQSMPAPSPLLTLEQVQQLQAMASTTMSREPAQIPKTGIGPGGVAGRRRPYRVDPRSTTT